MKRGSSKLIFEALLGDEPILKNALCRYARTFQNAITRFVKD